MPYSAKILIVDDQLDVLTALKFLFKSESIPADTTPSPRAALEKLAKNSYDCVLIDLNYTRDTTSGKEGLDLLSKIRELDDSLPVVVMTAWATVDLAVEAMRHGARDFIQKPWDNGRVLATVRNQMEFFQSIRKGRRLEAENKLLRKKPAGKWIAGSRAMKPVRELMEAVAPSDANILITGENGTGKGVIARMIHEMSARNEAPYITVNMGGLPAGVFESELFGHVKGAFTDAREDRVGRFELADEGTLFMDEIGNVPLDQQNRLLRLIETGEFERVGSSRTQKVDVRLVSATNADLDQMVAQGQFREDLLYRLNTITINLPPLRERLEDLEPLAYSLLEKYAKKYRKSIAVFHDQALERLREYDWPGNIRQLDHTVERAVLLCPDGEIQEKHLGIGKTPQGDTATTLDEMSLEEIEKYVIQRTLARNEGNALQAAKELGLSRSAFYRRLQRFGL